jgi:TPR repeat protein
MSEPTLDSLILSCGKTPFVLSAKRVADFYYFVMHDVKLATHWYMIAAGLGDAEAAAMLHTGLSVEDEKQVVDNYLKNIENIRTLDPDPFKRLTK